MLHAMRDLHSKGDFPAAASIAKDAAPYMHPRLSSIMHKGDAEEPLRLVERLVIIDADRDPGEEAASHPGELPAE